MRFRRKNNMLLNNSKRVELYRVRAFSQSLLPITGSQALLSLSPCLRAIAAPSVQSKLSHERSLVLRLYFRPKPNRHQV